MKPELSSERAWREACDWSEHRRGQLRELGRMTWPEKLTWLEEAWELAEHVHRAGIERRRAAREA